VSHAVELGLRAAEAASLPPTIRPAGIEAYEAVVRERWLAAQRTGADWYRRAARRFNTPFWLNAYAAGDN